MNIKKLLGVSASSAFLFVATTIPTFASGSVVGTWSVADHGQGCWGGGNLLSDGTGNGDGGCAFQTPQGEEVASISPQGWSFTDSTNKEVNLCATFIGKKGPVFPIGVPITQCLVVPVNTNTPVNIFGDTYAKATILP